MALNEQRTVPVWDLGVRLFHWSLVVLFVVAYLSGEEPIVVHAYAGYGIMGLLVFRIVWGFIGTQHARFGDFLFGPAKVLHYLKSLFTGSPEHYLGHNPAGGWMVLLLLLSLAATTWSGLEAYGAEGQGPLATDGISFVSAAYANGDEHDEDDEHDEHGERHEDHREGGDEFWEEVHEALSNFTVFLIVIHLLGVFVSSLLHGENLVSAMVNGRKMVR